MYSRRTKQNKSPAGLEEETQMTIKKINEKINYYNQLKKETTNDTKKKFYNDKLKQLRESKKELSK